MRIQQILLAGILLLLSTSIRAQSICSFDEKYNTLLKKDPAFAQKIEQSNRSIKEYIISKRARQNNTSKKTAAVVYTIPVVVHVMHTGGAVGSIYNPSDAQIEATIDYLNQVFAGTWPGMKPQHGASSVTDIEIRFALAQRSPGCGSTNGINRVNASALSNYVSQGINVNSSSGSNEIDLKNLSRWDPEKYYNIWLVNRIDGADGTSGQFVAGYAYYAGASPQLDGTVMLATQMLAGNKVLPHELGHALAVYHTFMGSANDTQCPSNTDCTTQGDGVCDTDPVSNNVNNGIYNFDCRTGLNNCVSPATNYTVNTEENIMAYTNCANLFTEGQKERMHAAMSLPSRASLVATSNMALISCGTEINFSQAGITVNEGNANSADGCRRYRDYSYQMLIGAGPSSAATVSLALSGTAVRGIDFELTTTGNFSSSTDELNFPAGFTTPQDFLIRIYDDANVETDETIVLDFSVNNGGGNALKGTTVPTFTFTIKDKNVQPVAAFSGQLTLGASSGIVDLAPYDARLSSQRIQMIYRASELQSLGLTAGSINSVAFNITQKGSGRPFNDFAIKMGHTTLNYLVNQSVTPASGLSTVFTTASHSTTAGWNVYTLSNPFTWDGESNVAIEICFNNGTANSGGGRDRIATYLDGSGSGQGNMIFQQITCNTGFSSISYFDYGRKPVVRLGVITAGTEVETELGAATTVHMKANGSEYLYNNDKLIARVYDTDSDLECVTATLSGAGTAWPSFSGGQRSAKAFTISPAINSNSSNYSVSLYFNNAELNGLNPANLRMAKTNASNIADANMSNTVVVTPVVSTLGSNITMFTANFTGFSSFFLVTNSVTLPITLLDFAGNVINGQGVALRWNTSSENQNIGFDVERSSDAKHFYALTTIYSKGDTRIGYSYQYTDETAQAGTYYYRLKQKDADGKIEYSKVLAFTTTIDEPITLAPVPARDYVTVKLHKPTDHKTIIQVYSATSQKLADHIMPGGSYQYNVPLQGFSPGIYFLRIYSSRQTKLIRFVKQ